MKNTVKTAQEEEIVLNEIGEGKGFVSMEDLEGIFNFLIEKPVNEIFNKYDLKPHEIIGASKILTYLTGKQGI
jgi:hypothetical protein